MITDHLPGLYVPSGPTAGTVAAAVVGLVAAVLQEHHPDWAVEDDDARSLADLASASRRERDAVMGHPVRYALVSVAGPERAEGAPGTTRLRWPVAVQMWLGEGDGSAGEWAAARTGRDPAGLVTALLCARTLAVTVGGVASQLRITPPTEGAAFRGAFGPDNTATHYARFTFTLS